MASCCCSKVSFSAKPAMLDRCTPIAPDHLCRAPSQFDHLVNDIQCPISHLPLYKAVTLVPCGDKINEVVARALLGVGGEGGSLSRNLDCPLCRRRVESYYPDLSIRSLAEAITVAKIEKLQKEQKYQEAILDLAARIAPKDGEMGLKIATLPPIEWFSKKLFDEIQCPVKLTPMISAITLIPCCHKVSQKALEDDLLQHILTVGCPICRKTVQKCIPDRKMSSLAQIVVNMRAEKRRLEFLTAKALQDLAIKKAQANESETARAIAQTITCKKVQKITVEQIAIVEQSVSERFVERAKSLANEGEFAEALRVSNEIALDDQRANAREYIKMAVECTRNEAAKKECCVQ